MAKKLPLHGAGLVDRMEHIKDNDAFRGSILDSPGILCLSLEVQQCSLRRIAKILNQVVNYSEFKKRSDRHGDHSQGEIVVDGQTFTWKITCVPAVCRASLDFEGYFRILKIDVKTLTKNPQKNRISATA
jgi:hypothetical protein